LGDMPNSPNLYKIADNAIKSITSVTKARSIKTDSLNLFLLPVIVSET
jgi:hypothetical protein